MLSIVKTKLENIAHRKLGAWLSNRMPAREHQVLSQKNIFILPSKFGFTFISFTLLIFILGTNYQNNLILLLSYLLSSLFITSMLFCFLNMAGLEISAKGKYFTFCGEGLLIPIKVESDRKRFSFNFSFADHKSITVNELAIKQQIEIPVNYKVRGRKQLPRLTVSTEFPLGLFYCWTHLQFEIEAIVSPKPVACHSVSGSLGEGRNNEDMSVNVDIRSTSGDFYELRPFKKGESLKQVAWKQLAKTGNWMVSQQHQEFDDTVTLCLDDMPASQLENRLQHLCYLVLEYHYANKTFGLALGTKNILPASGSKHLNSCLLAMAIYE